MIGFDLGASDLIELGLKGAVWGLQIVTIKFIGFVLQQKEKENEVEDGKGMLYLAKVRQVQPKFYLKIS